MQVPKEKRRIHVHLFVWLAVLVIAPAATARGYMTNGFRTKESRPMTLVLLPPHAEFIKAKAVMTEEMVKECRGLEDAAASWVAERLGEKEYTVRSLTVEELEKDPELRDLVKRVNDRYQEEWSKIVRRPGKLKYGRYNIGDDARKLCSVLNVDGILLARIQAVGVTAGKKWLSGLISLGNYVPQGYGRLDSSVVNGKTGTVEGYFFYVQSASLKYLTQKQDKLMMNTSKKCFRRYPGAAEVLKARGLDAEAEEEEDKDEEDIIGEFEALLAEDEEEEEQEQESNEEPSVVKDAESESEEGQSEEAQESDTAQDTEE